MKPTKVAVAVIGGGLAGLTSSILLAKSGWEVILFEKKKYPFHRVCGEYVSNEVLSFLKREGLFTQREDIPQIRFFEFSDTKGRKEKVSLDLGGFGISRYFLDEFLVKKALEAGVKIQSSTQVEEVFFEEKEDHFYLNLAGGGQVQSKWVIGSFGKRSKLDKSLSRDFITKRSPYLGVKYHIRTQFPRDTVALYNFQGGYCGINAIEEGKFNLCYLGNREDLRKYGSIESMEQEVLLKNPLLKGIWSESEFLFEKPEVISEINFEPKNPVENHILMAGDAAGLITPLCGNGMAMAIHAGKLAAEAVAAGRSREDVEKRYLISWNQEFRQRLWVGRQAQRLFGSGKSSGLAYHLIGKFPTLADWIIRQTHGKPF